MFRLSCVFVVAAYAGTCHGSMVTAEVAMSGDGVFVSLARPEFVFSDSYRRFWDEVPNVIELGDFVFWQAESDGISTSFGVVTSGPVLMAVTAQWTDGRLVTDGWEEFATGLVDRDTLVIDPPLFQSLFPPEPEPNVEYVIYFRDSVAGETLTYSDGLVRPPIVIQTVPVVVPEPSSDVLLVIAIVAIILFCQMLRSRASRLH